MSVIESTVDAFQSSSPSLFDKFQDLNAARSADHDIQYVAALRERYQGLTVTAVPTLNVNLRAFAAAGYAVAELDVTPEDPVASWRGWVPALSGHEQGGIGESVFFAKYHYQWKNEYFILYTVKAVQYVLKEPRGDESPLSSSGIVDELIAAAGRLQTEDKRIVWVFDGYWSPNKALWEQVQKAEWENVILDAGMKKALIDVSEKFFESKSIYEDLGVPWKRGVIFHGPPGNGKTISIKALMHTLQRHNNTPTLYVKSAINTYQIRAVFQFARRLAPCLLVFEDIDTIVTERTRSYFFNEVDGLESNEGILMIASTNHLDQLDPGLSKRPSRFDRKYLFPLPDEHERALYAEFWRKKLHKKGDKVEFPEKLCPAIASITDGFSFAFMQEAFVATLLIIARENMDEGDVSDHDILSTDDDLKDVHLWQVFKKQVHILREDMDTSNSNPRPVHQSLAMGSAFEHTMPEDNAMSRMDRLKWRNICESPGTDLRRLNPGHEPASVPLVAPGFNAVGVKFNFINPAAFEQL